MARNVAHQDGRTIARFTTAAFDLIPIHGDYSQEADRANPQYYYRPWKTVLVRTVADGGSAGRAPAGYGPEPGESPCHRGAGTLMMTPMSVTAATIRPYRPADQDRLAEICVRTGHAGGDARGYFAEPEILPAIFASPYAEHDPGLVFVADRDGEAIGYVLGAADSAAYFAYFRQQWLPRVADRFPAAAGDLPEPDAGIRRLLHHPEAMFVPAFQERHPAHLHIDLLPEGQGLGLGRRLMETYLDALRRRGVPGVHLGMNPDNTRARAFYDRMGFTELRAPGADAGVLHLGLTL
jgi:ribosomal protein S18 acetylase RimI-like enzyme